MTTVFPSLKTQTTKRCTLPSMLSATPVVLVFPWLTVATKSLCSQVARPESPWQTSWSRQGNVRTLLVALRHHLLLLHHFQSRGHAFWMETASPAPTTPATTAITIVAPSGPISATSRLWRLTPSRVGTSCSSTVKPILAATAQTFLWTVPTLSATSLGIPMVP